MVEADLDQHRALGLFSTFEREDATALRQLEQHGDRLVAIVRRWEPDAHVRCAIDLAGVMLQMPQWMRTLREQTRALDREVTRAAVDQLIAPLRAAWTEQLAVTEWLDTHVGPSTLPPGDAYDRWAAARTLRAPGLGIGGPLRDAEAGSSLRYGCVHLVARKLRLAPPATTDAVAVERVLHTWTVGNGRAARTDPPPSAVGALAGGRHIHELPRAR